MAAWWVDRRQFIGLRATPTSEQRAWQDLAMGMFIHFAPNTWQDREYDDLSAPLSEINPEKLDTDQWVGAAVKMGAKYIVFVAKHAGGFCMWQTATTDYGMKSAAWRGGKGDVLADLAASCRKRGMALGVYLSPQDARQGAGGGGRCKTPEAQAAYDRMYREQLTELLAKYGRMTEVWFDGSLVVPVGDILRKFAPGAMVFQGPHATIRWVGNEVRRRFGRAVAERAGSGAPVGSASGSPVPEFVNSVRRSQFVVRRSHVTSHLAS